MDKIKIYLNDISKVNRFLKVVRQFDEEVDIFNDLTMCDAKSVLGVYSLDLSKPVFIRVLSANEITVSSFRKAMEEFSEK